MKNESKTETTLLKQQENSTRFLRSYRIQKMMSTVSGYDESMDMTTSRPVQVRPRNSYSEQPLAAGQIRLIGGLDQIAYVVLLRRWEKDSFVVTSFSHFDFPATDEEFKPEFDGGMYMNTLQVWNTRTLQDKTLKDSWLIGSMPESDCTDAWKFWDHTITGVQLEDRLLEKSGAPIVDQNDPRIEYIQEELSIFQKIDAMELEESAAAEDVPELTLVKTSGVQKNDAKWWEKLVLPEIWPSAEFAFAAGQGKRNSFAECTVAHHDEIATIEYAPHEKTLRVLFYSADESQFSKVFDNWELVDVNANALGHVVKGKCIVQNLDEFDGQCALRNPEGRIFIFEKKVK